MIHNVRRSGNQSEDIVIKVCYHTTPEKIQQLRDHLLAFLNANTRDYTPKIEINCIELIDRNQMTFKMSLEHKGNFQDGGKRNYRRNRFMYALREGIEKFDIHLPGGPLEVKMEQVGSFDHKL